MIFIVLQDDGSYNVVQPDKLALRQMEDGLAALGIEVQVPQFEEDGKTPKLIDEGGRKVQAVANGFKSFINYPVTISKPAVKSVELTEVPEVPPLPPTESAK